MKTASASELTSADWIEVVIRKVSTLRFGSVQITVHDGKVTQVESVEKTRFVPLKENQSSSGGG
jgi:hypothetical protein